jgi:phosphoglycolate phosphatase
VIPQPPSLIFDLDGTLTDSKLGIVGCLRNVLNARNIDHRGPLDRFVGPPADQWTLELLPDGSQEARAELVRDYRACYDSEGWKINSVFPGVRGLLDELHKEGFPLYVCTSKQHHTAVKILELFQLSELFTGIYGDKLEYASHQKANLLASLMREHSLNPEHSWMIGDRIYDFKAARVHQMRCLAAGWGYGSADEFAHADAVAATPADVRTIVSTQL